MCDGKKKMNGWGDTGFLLDTAAVIRYNDNHLVVVVQGLGVTANLACI